MNLKFVKLFVGRVFQIKKVFNFLILVFVCAPVLVFFNNCSVGLFSSQGALGSLDSSSLSQEDLNLIAGQKLYTTNCSGCHGGVDASAKKGRSLGLITEALTSVPQMSSLRTKLSSADLALIAKALEIPTLPLTTINGRTGFSCDPNLVAKTPIIKLSNREYKTALFSLLDDFSTSLSGDATLAAYVANIPWDVVKADRFASKEQNFLLTFQTSKAYFNSSFRAGVLVANSNNLGNYPNTGSCLTSGTITQSCHQMFVREFGSRAFRKNLSVTDGNILAAGLWDSSLSKSDLITLTFTTITQMPDFMYRVYDQGTQSVRGARVLSLTGAELASKLSFFLIGKPPDAELRSLATSGQILNRTTLNQQADRLLATPDAQDTIKRLFRENYGYDKFDNFNYSEQFLSGLSSGNLTSSMPQELDNLFVDVVLTRKSTFRDLMTTQDSDITSKELADVYGVSAVGKNTLQPNRAGFINRAAFLARKSGNYTSPIKRGLAILENVLCEAIGDPPPNAPTSVSEEQIMGQYHSTRERYARLSEVKGTACILCHSRINSLGYTFETFDSIGRARQAERIFLTSSGPSVATVAIDTQTIVPDLRAMPTSIRDSADLATDLSNNDKAMMCFTKQLKNFQSRVSATAADGCQMNASLKTLYGTSGNQGSIHAAIKELILSEDFKLWSY